MPIGYAFLQSVTGGQAGTAGGTTGNAGSLTLPVNGIRVTGGTGGGGLPAAATTGSSGGAFGVPATPSYFPAQSGGLGSATATVAADPGRHGFRIEQAAANHYYYGGTGGASTHGSATGAGLTQARGGNGAIGSGGGGMGGALTGSTPASLSLGGPGLVVITCY